MNRASSGAGTSNDGRDSAGSAGEHDARNLLEELAGITDRITRVRRSDRADFIEGSPSHDAACMAVIRLKSLTEVPEFSDLTALIDEAQLAGLARVRNIAAHGGYLEMNDDILWDVVTERLGPIVDLLKQAVSDRTD